MHLHSEVGRSDIQGSKKANRMFSASVGVMVLVRSLVVYVQYVHVVSDSDSADGPGESLPILHFMQMLPVQNPDRTLRENQRLINIILIAGLEALIQ